MVVQNRVASLIFEIKKAEQAKIVRFQAVLVTISRIFEIGLSLIGKQVEQSREQVGQAEPIEQTREQVVPFPVHLVQFHKNQDGLFVVFEFAKVDLGQTVGEQSEPLKRTISGSPVKEYLKKRHAYLQIDIGWVGNFFVHKYGDFVLTIVGRIDFEKAVIMVD